MNSSHPDDDAEVFELDQQFLGGYYPPDWLDIARVLEENSRNSDLVERIRAVALRRGISCFERVNVASSQEEVEAIRHAAAVAGVR